MSRSASTVCLVISCEHGGCQVPAPYAELFKGQQQVLQSHRGWDPGALKMAKHFARILKAPLYFSTTTRLLVELNRSLGHPRLFSEFSQQLSMSQKETLLIQHWYPYRQAVESVIAQHIGGRRRVLHVSVHSFTPVWDGEVRATDIGLLYDPARSAEKQFCLRWRNALKQAAPDLTIHRNSPYKGTSDGFVTQLRRQHASHQYLGIELEVNQRYFLNSTATEQGAVLRLLTDSLRDAMLARSD